MRRGFTAGVLVLVAAVTVAASRQQSFRAGVDLATFGVTVVDRKGYFAPDKTSPK